MRSFQKVESTTFVNRVNRRKKVSEEQCGVSSIRELIEHLQRILEKTWRAELTGLRRPCDIHVQILGRQLDKVDWKINREI